MSDGSGMTVLCSYISDFRFSDENAICVGREIADNVLGYFMLYVLTNVYSVGKSFIAKMPL